jgi:predicted dinucleotide-binding enzyme
MNETLARIPRFRLLLITATALAAPLGSAAASLSAQSGIAEREGRSMKIGIIGAGTMGGGIGQLWADAGHQILYSSRNPSELMDLVRSGAPRASAGYADAAAYFGDVILLAVPPSATPQIAEDFGQLMRGKVVIDLSNPRLDRDGPITTEWLEMGTGLAMAQYLPGVRLVRAFNTLGSRMLQEAHRQGELIGVPIAGDDEDAVGIAVTLVRDAGFDPVVVGPLARAKEFDRATPVYVTGMTAREIQEALGLR